MPIDQALLTPSHCNGQLKPHGRVPHPQRANAIGSLTILCERAVNECGEGGIRTLGTLAGTLVFETSTIGRSVTSPMKLPCTLLAAR